MDFNDVRQIPAIWYSGGITQYLKNSEVTIEPFVITKQESNMTIEVSMTSPKWHISSLLKQLLQQYEIALGKHEKYYYKYH